MKCEPWSKSYGQSLPTSCRRRHEIRARWFAPSGPSSMQAAVFDVTTAVTDDTTARVRLVTRLGFVGGSRIGSLLPVPPLLSDDRGCGAGGRLMRMGILAACAALALVASLFLTGCAIQRSL